MRDTVHVGIVRSFDTATKVATVVVPALFGDTPVHAQPLTLGSIDLSSIPGLSVGSNVAIFFDGGTDRSKPYWFTGGGLQQVQWNTARGTVARGSFDGMGTTGDAGSFDLPANYNAWGGTPISYNFIRGRRYRLEVGYRAWAGSASGGLQVSMSLRWWVDGVVRIEMGDPWLTSMRQWESSIGAIEVNCGDAITEIPPGIHVVQPAIVDQSNTAIKIWKAGSYWVVKDEGPITPVVDSFVPPQTPVSEWQVIPLLNGWANYGGWPTPRVKKVNGRVIFEGLINGAAATADNFALLPQEYWPSASRPAGQTSQGPFLVQAGGSGVQSVARVDIGWNGNMGIVPGPTPYYVARGALSHLSLDQIAYDG